MSGHLCFFCHLDFVSFSFDLKRLQLSDPPFPPLSIGTTASKWQVLWVLKNTSDIWQVSAVLVIFCPSYHPSSFAAHTSLVCRLGPCGLCSVEHASLQVSFFTSWWICPLGSAGKLSQTFWDMPPPWWRLGIEIGKKTSSQRLCFGLSNGSKFRSWLYYRPSCVAFSKWFNLLKALLPRESQMWGLLCVLSSFLGDLEGLVYRSEASHRLLYIKPPQTQVSPQTLLTQNPRDGTWASIFLKVPQVVLEYSHSWELIPSALVLDGLPTHRQSFQLQPAVPVMSASAACSLHALCRDCLRNGTSRAAHRCLVCILIQLGGMFPAWICRLAYRTTLPRLNYCQFLLQALISLSRCLTCVCFFHLFLALWHSHCGRYCQWPS